MKLSQRTENLRHIDSFAHELPGSSVPRFEEIPASIFEEEIRSIPFPDPKEEPVSSGYDRPYPYLVDHYASFIAESSAFRTAIDRAAQKILADSSLMVRCAPVVPAAHTGLSFAGTYPSFIPKPFPQDLVSVHASVASVLAGKHTEYANYYHDRHQIDAHTIELGVMIMELVGNPAIHGTGYSFQDNVRIEYVFDPKLSHDHYALQTGANHLVDDRFGKSVNQNRSEFCKEIEFEERIVSALRTIEANLEFPSDVEFLVDTNGTINIVQARPISDAHLRNWIKYYQQSYADVEISQVRRAIINSVGSLSLGAGLYSIGHTDIFNFIQNLDDRASVQELVIVHDDDRVRNHLQYAVFEDPFIGSVYHVDHTELEVIQQNHAIYSNGDSYLV